MYIWSKELGQWNKSVFKTENSVFENILLRRVFELDRQGVTKSVEKFHTEGHDM